MPSLSEADLRIDRPRASILGAFLEGWRRVLRAPMITLGVFALTLLTALPLAIALRGQIERHLGSSLEADRLLEGWNAVWASEFSRQTTIPGGALTHEILGFGGALALLSRLLDAQSLDAALAAVVTGYVVLWLFLSGGILDRLARGRPVGPSTFFAACGVYFLRFLRLALPVGAAYVALFVWLHPLLFGTLYSRWIRDATAEHQVLMIRGGLYLTFLAALMLVSLVADFAKVRAVVEDRRSMVGAVAAAMRFVRHRPWRVGGLYLLNILAVVVILRLWMQTAPGAAAPTWAVFLAAQVYVLARLWAKLAFMASEVAFFQGELAHATFTSAPEPIWPESPAVEAIRNLRQP
jgi:hypothetical protein